MFGSILARRSVPRALQQGIAIRCFSSPPQPSPSAFDPALVAKTPEEMRKDYITYTNSKVRDDLMLFYGSCWSHSNELVIVWQTREFSRYLIRFAFSFPSPFISISWANIVATLTNLLVLFLPLLWTGNMPSVMVEEEPWGIPSSTFLWNAQVLLRLANTAVYDTRKSRNTNYFQDDILCVFELQATSYGGNCVVIFGWQRTQHDHWKQTRYNYRTHQKVPNNGQAC